MNLSWKNCAKIGITAFLLFICIHYCDNVLRFLTVILSAASPLIIGFIIAYVLNILMAFYEKYYFPKSNKATIIKTRRPVCMIASLLTLFSIVSLVIYLVIPELVSCITFIISEIPPLIEKTLQSDWIAEIVPKDILANLSKIDWQEYLTKAVEVLTSGIGNAVNTIIVAVTSIFSVIVRLFVGIIFAIYLLLSKEKLQRRSATVMNHYLKSKWTKKIMYFLSVLNDSFHRFIVGQCTEAVILGVLCMLGMFILRLPHAVMIGTLIGFTALIPVAGAYIGAAAGALMILTISPIQALIFLIFLIILQNVEGNIIYPKVVGNSIGLPALFVLAAVTIGGGLFGVIGMLVGVPLTSAVYRLLKEDVEQRNTPLTINQTK